MASITLKGQPIHTSGDLPAIGDKAPNFSLTTNDLADVNLGVYAGKRKLLNIFPSLDTSVCATSVRKFNQEAAQLPDTAVLNISADLPFAQKRFCVAEGIQNAQTLSSFRSSFAEDYGLKIIDGPLKGLCSRAVLVLDQDNMVIHAEQVAEIAQEPDYAKALAALK